MHFEAEAILNFGVYGQQQPIKVVRAYRREYKVIDEILSQHPEILEIVRGNLAKLSQTGSRRGRKADFSSENLFRTILVMQREGFDYRWHWTPWRTRWLRSTMLESHEFSPEARSISETAARRTLQDSRASTGKQLSLAAVCLRDLAKYVENRVRQRESPLLVSLDDHAKDHLLRVDRRDGQRASIGSNVPLAAPRSSRT